MPYTAWKLKRMLFKGSAAMRHGNIPGLERSVSRLIQGTVMLPSDEEAMMYALFDSILELGCNTFDTAHAYNNGEAERSFGRWVESRGVRNDIVIIGKGAHHSADRKCVTPYDISGHLHDSLVRLRTDYIDLYMLHRDDPTQPVGPLMETLNDHINEGKIRAIGASNWTSRRIAEANLYAVTRGLVPFAVSSPQYSLAEMIDEPWENCVSISGPQGESERGWYLEHDVAVFAWSALAGGFLSGRLTRQNVRKHEGQRYHRCYVCEANLKRIDRAEELAAAKKVTVAQLAIAWLLHQQLEVYPIVASYHPREFEDLVKSFDIDLSEIECEWLDLERDVRV